MNLASYALAGWLAGCFASHLGAGREVDDAHGALGGVHVLTAGAAGSVHVDAQVLRREVACGVPTDAPASCYFVYFVYFIRLF